jgi:hypothetical protein
MISDADRTRIADAIGAAEAKRYVEIIADGGINAKVTQEVWDAAVASLIAAIEDGRAGDGFAAAIEQCSAVLAEHFPAAPARSIRTSCRTDWWRYRAFRRVGRAKAPALTPDVSRTIERRARHSVCGGQRRAGSMPTSSVA